ncbi:hypothetical protein VB620_03795 [Nodularia harveyana UHCC-0300]|uniref:Uncharacterized protein n=1 Tax=Nodularia harveyana UHCC-0300 TaxID=2974287 RepID=A0ABU5UAC2_9CYAN|nr:hypothetical protein [Nodularia harveyana]MEA5580463.1 hypothetical protein [Nodularia harveyana UHCC-0300]
MEEFSLNARQTLIMFIFQYHLVLADIIIEKDLHKKYQKNRWLSCWQESIELFLKENFPNDTLKITNDFDSLKMQAKEHINESGSKLTSYNILLELTLFKAYYLLGHDDDEKFKYLGFNEDELIRKLKSFARILDKDSEIIRRLKSNYKEAIKGIKDENGFNPWILVGAVVLAVTSAFFTPAIAYLLAPILAPGLSGAAAVSAVLAALGGGAIAVGGFGMAGGFTVLVAGGAILGAGASASASAGISALFAQAPDSALVQAAKLEVIFREIVFIEKELPLAREVIKLQRQFIHSLEDKLDDLLIDKEKNKEEIKNLEKSIKYLKKALKRNQDLL